MDQGNPMFPISTDYQLRLTNVWFEPSFEIGQNKARVEGFLKPDSNNDVHRFSLVANFDANKKLWKIDICNFNWISPVQRTLFDPRNIHQVCTRVLDSFRLLWMQPVPSEENVKGASLRFGHTLMNSEQETASFAIFRGDIHSFYHLDWRYLWDAIENRLSFDPEFWVNGFNRQEAIRAVGVLKSVFPWEWVRKRYRNYSKNSIVGMWNEMQADQGFPAYQLARTAIGCICKDPGWNYLITLAQSCNSLKKYPKGASFLKRISKNPGDIHHANFAGYLHQRGMLAEIEPPTGSGNATNDLAVKIGEILIDIEMKSLTSMEPARQIGQEVLDKCRKLPSIPKRPIVFFALLVEKPSTGEEKTQQQQLDTFTTGLMANSTGVSAIVVGRMFIDATGGLIKWSFEKFLPNEQAHHQISEVLLRQIFKPNWERIRYPCMPIVFSYNLNDKPAAVDV